ncbi:hypothetical protein SUNI508_01332 [Seiridium unicorne]|uniref:Uncharacterized protein n=1 Tax=Seiridium unicorne TaxID=138068 RepID=A0ABR2UYL4_9PEZI
MDSAARIDDLVGEQSTSQLQTTAHPIDADYVRQALESDRDNWQPEISSLEEALEWEAAYASLNNADDPSDCDVSDFPIDDPQAQGALALRLARAMMNTEDTLEEVSREDKQRDKDSQGPGSKKKVPKKKTIKHHPHLVHIKAWTLLWAIYYAQKGTCRVPAWFSARMPTRTECANFMARFELIEGYLMVSKTLCNSFYEASFEDRLAYYPEAEMHIKIANKRLNTRRDTKVSFGDHMMKNRDDYYKDNEGNFRDRANGQLISQSESSTLSADYRKLVQELPTRKRGSDQGLFVDALGPSEAGKSQKRKAPSHDAIGDNDEEQEEAPPRKSARKGKTSRPTRGSRKGGYTAPPQVAAGPADVVSTLKGGQANTLVMANGLNKPTVAFTEHSGVQPGYPGAYAAALSSAVTQDAARLNMNYLNQGSSFLSQQGFGLFTTDTPRTYGNQLSTLDGFSLMNAFVGATSTYNPVFQTSSHPHHVQVNPQLLTQAEFENAGAPSYATYTNDAAGAHLLLPFIATGEQQQSQATTAPKPDWTESFLAKLAAAEAEMQFTEDHAPPPETTVPDAITPPLTLDDVLKCDPAQDFFWPQANK